MKEIPFLQIKKISKSYPGVEALKDVSFDITEGSVHALLGENGAGKSTLIKIIAGAEKANPGGEIWVNGALYNPQNPRDALDNNIATIYQNLNLLPDRTIMENVLLGKEPTRRGFLDLQQFQRQTTTILESLDAGYLSPRTLINELKIGEKQIIEIAKALINQSKLLIMDEPTAALNQTEAEALFKNIHKLRREGVTIIYVSHRLDEIFQLADVVTVLRDGHHILTKPTIDVNRESLIEAMIGRKLENIYPEQDSIPGEEVFRAEDITCGNVLKGISFSLARGEVLAIAGLSGSGKSELGKALFGILPIDRGKLFFHGVQYRPRPARSIRSGITYLPEDRKVDGLFSELVIRRNISLSVLSIKASSKIKFINKQREREVAQSQIDALDIKTPSMEQQIYSLSGGNQQKVVLGRSLAVDPEVFILSEPTQGIDVGVKYEIYQLITEQARAGKAILLISSELSEIMGLAHRILVMHDGRIVASLKSSETDQAEILRYALGEEQPQREYAVK
jgi:ribose transport system ATP-binding protein